MNSVHIIGFLRETIDDNFRTFEYELPFMIENNEAPTKINLIYWTKQPKNIVMSLPMNTRVAIQGHLDGHPKFGTILVVEQIQSIK